MMIITHYNKFDPIKLGVLKICAPQNGGGLNLSNNKLSGELFPIAYQVNDSLQVGGESVKVDTLINTVTLTYGITGNQLAKHFTNLKRMDNAPFTPMGEKPDLFDVQDNNVVLFSGLNTDIRCSYLSIGLSINTVCESLLTAGGIPTVKYNQWVITYPIGGCWNNQGITGNKKGSTANATSLNSYYLKFYTNDKSNTNVNLFNILVQRRLIVNYLPDCLGLPCLRLSDSKVDLGKKFSESFFCGESSLSDGVSVCLFIDYSTSGLDFCFRCLRLISALAAVVKKPAVLSPSSFNASISSKSSKGSLTDTCSDLLFFLPVAITGSPSYRWCSVYTKLFHKKTLTWCSPLNTLVVFTFGFIGNRNSNAPKCVNTIEAFNHNVKRGNTMATYKSTQTHPKFLWRFFSCQQFKYFLVEAINEQEARSMLPDSPCIFSARICPEVMHG